MANNLNESLGGYGAGTIVTVDGKDWRFVFDVPLLVSNMEEMCQKWRRELLEQELRDFPGRDVPGSFDERQALTLWNEFRADLRNDSLRSPRYDRDGNIVGGARYIEWSNTPDGQHASFLAALKISHPEATVESVKRILISAPDQMQAVLEDLGNVVRGVKDRVVASLKKKSPAEAEKMNRKVEEMIGTALNG